MYRKCCLPCGTANQIAEVNMTDTIWIHFYQTHSKVVYFKQWNETQSPLHIFAEANVHICTFLVRLGITVWPWGCWWRLTVVLAQLHWPLSWWPSRREMPFASHSFVSNQPLSIWYSRWALPVPGTVTSKHNQCFLYFCMNLVSVLLSNHPP